MFGYVSVKVKSSYEIVMTYTFYEPLNLAQRVFIANGQFCTAKNYERNFEKLYIYSGHIIPG